MKDENGDYYGFHLSKSKRSRQTKTAAQKARVKRERDYVKGCPSLNRLWRPLGRTGCLGRQIPSEVICARDTFR